MEEFYIKYKDLTENEEIKSYIIQADLSLKAMNYTEHSFVHVGRVAHVVKLILSGLGYSKREINLGQIAAYMHDIGNVVNRVDHAQSGAIMAFRILDKLGMSAKDIASVITAIGNHDEVTAFPVNAITAALILGDKTDVRRSRVRNVERSSFDIHDRVNYAVVSSNVGLDLEKRQVSLVLEIDTSVCAIMDYFEIFLNRMILCKRAAEFLNLEFKLVINNLAII